MRHGVRSLLFHLVPILIYPFHHIATAAAQSSYETATRTTSGHFSTTASCLYLLRSAPSPRSDNISMCSLGAFFCHVPWLGPYVGSIPGAAGPLSTLMGHARRFAAARIQRGSSTRDLFHYLVRSSILGYQYDADCTHCVYTRYALDLSRTTKTSPRSLLRRPNNSSMTASSRSSPGQTRPRARYSASYSA